MDAELAQLERLVRVQKNQRVIDKGGLIGEGRCYCYQYENHDGGCLGPECDCHI